MTIFVTLPLTLLEIQDNTHTIRRPTPLLVGCALFFTDVIPVWNRKGFSSNTVFVSSHANSVYFHYCVFLVVASECRLMTS